MNLTEISTAAINSAMVGTVRTSKAVLVLKPELFDQGGGQFVWKGGVTVQWKGLNGDDPAAVAIHILRTAADSLENNL